jgi:hypothetical protein
MTNWCAETPCRHSPSFFSLNHSCVSLIVATGIGLDPLIQLPSISDCLKGSLSNPDSPFKRTAMQGTMIPEILPHWVLYNSMATNHIARICTASLRKLCANLDGVVRL